MFKFASISFCIVSFITSAYCEENLKTGKLSRDCGNSYSITCLKLDIVSFIDKLNEEDSYSVFPGISLVRENSTSETSTAEMVSELAREFPNDAEARLDNFLLRKIGGYIGSHTLQFNLWNSTEEDGVSSRRKKNGMGYIIAAAAIMKGTLLALALGGLATIAGKALMTSIISLLLSALLGLRSITGGFAGKQTTYEIISKPLYSQANTQTAEIEHAGHYSGYGRSLDVPLPLKNTRITLPSK
ncbi:hypothetical protein HHI36_007167 [Cryptolaemus montrouzieri]|uniref:Osiris 16 n=1 Tax=Cryptolaemus montrouzieri TaxID=559131 RepID=A0ABD2MNW0_9CUCU